MTQEGQNSPAKVKHPWWFHGAILALFIIAFFLLEWTSLVQKNVTFDEPYHLLRGTYPFKTGQLCPNQFHPPLINMIAAIPLALDPKVGVVTFDDARLLDLYSFSFLSDNGQDLERMLYSARLMIVVLGIFLLILVYVWAFEIAGIGGALTAAFLITLSPNILAHAQIATIDIGLSFFMFFSSYLFWKWLCERRRQFLFLSGLALGGAILSKYTAIILYPVFLATLLFDWKTDETKQELTFRNRLMDVRDFSVIVILSLAPLLLIYGIKPSAYFFHLQDFSKSAFRNTEAYFLGRYHTTSMWYFPLAIFAVKTPLPTLILTTFSVAAVFFRKSIRKVRLAKAIAVLFPIFILLLLVSVKKNKEMRYLLPALPFFFLLIGLFFAEGGRKVRIFSLVMMLWIAFENAAVYPDYLTYFNQILGGPWKGSQYFLDSNSDWGQDLKGLARYMRENNIGKVGLAYFGKASPLYYKINFQPLPPIKRGHIRYSSLGYFLNAKPMEKLKGYVAVSLYWLLKRDPYFDVFRKKKPVASIGNTIYMYKF